MTYLLGVPVGATLLGRFRGRTRDGEDLEVLWMTTIQVTHPGAVLVTSWEAAWLTLEGLEVADWIQGILKTEVLS